VIEERIYLLCLVTLT